MKRSRALQKRTADSVQGTGQSGEEKTGEEKRRPRFKNRATGEKMTFSEIRTKIADAVEVAFTAVYSKDETLSLLYNEFKIPETLPAAIIVRDKKTGILGTARRYIEHEHGFVIYLIVDAQDVEDPDSDIDDFEVAFNAAYVAEFGKDYQGVEYYPSRVDAREVRVAKIMTSKGLD
jgi:hypothetical protein